MGERQRASSSIMPAMIKSSLITAGGFKNPRGALAFAEETLRLLKNGLKREWDGWSIEVYSPEGAKLFSLSIDAPEIIRHEEEECEQGRLVSAR